MWGIRRLRMTATLWNHLDGFFAHLTARAALISSLRRLRCREPDPLRSLSRALMQKRPASSGQHWEAVCQGRAIVVLLLMLLACRIPI